jgi:hypothetical protein
LVFDGPELQTQASFTIAGTLRTAGGFAYFSLFFYLPLFVYAGQLYYSRNTTDSGCLVTQMFFAIL